MSDGAYCHYCRKYECICEKVTDYFRGGSIYAGIGSRKTPENILNLFWYIGGILAKRGWKLRSGGAVGADSCFENGCDQVPHAHKEIFYHTHGKRNAESCDYHLHRVLSPSHIKNMGEYALNLHRRNVMQILGDDFLSPSDLVICYTEGGKLVGGTATALKLADLYKIKVLNAGNPNDLEVLETFYRIGTM